MTLPLCQLADRLMKHGTWPCWHGQNFVTHPRRPCGVLRVSPTCMSLPECAYCTPAGGVWTGCSFQPVAVSASLALCAKPVGCADRIGFEKPRHTARKEGGLCPSDCEVMQTCFQSWLYSLTSLTPAFDLKSLATLEPLPSWFKQRDKRAMPFELAKLISDRLFTLCPVSAVNSLIDMSRYCRFPDSSIEPLMKPVLDERPSLEPPTQPED